MTHDRSHRSLKTTLLAATLLSGAAAGAWADDAAEDNFGMAPLPTGQFITPTFATGSTFAVLNPDQPEYTSAIGNYPFFKPDGAIASRLSPDGKTLAVMTSGYNVLDDANASLVGRGTPFAGAEFIILYDVTNPRAPAKKQTLRPPNTFAGLAFSPDGSKLYVSGGSDDQVVVYTQSAGAFAQTSTIALNHGKYPGNLIGGKRVAGGIGSGQFPLTAGVSVSADGTLLAVANALNNSVAVYRTADAGKVFEYDLRPFNTTPGSDGVAGGETLYSVAFKGNSTLYATSLRDREVVVVDFGAGQPSLTARIKLPGSPNNMVFNKAQTTLYVSQDNSDTVAVIDAASNTVTEQIDAVAPAGVLADRSNRYTGAAVNNVALSPDEQTLYVTEGGANDVAIVPLAGPAPHAVSGLIPTAWYPTAVTVGADGGTLYVFNSKSDPGGNPNKNTSSLTSLVDTKYPGGNTGALRYSANQYVFQLEQSGLLVAPVPAPSDLSSLTSQVAANNGWRVLNDPRDAATVAFLKAHIQHVIYIVKENRTFDQVLGDLTNGANADPTLAIFGRPITPNFHRIASNFVTLDNFFDSGEVSGNGWPWSTAGRETDWNEKMIPMNYTFSVNRQDAPYDAEGQNNNVDVGYVGLAARQASAGGYDYAANAANYAGGAANMLPGTGDVGAPDGANGAAQGGYIWSAALRAGLTVRDYGMFSDNNHYGLSAGSPGYSAPVEFPYQLSLSNGAGAQQMWVTNPELIPNTDIYFRGFDTGYPDTWRYEEFKREFAAFDANRTLPNLVLLRYMRDHMGSFGTGSQAGTGTPEAEQADNDFAVGKTLELLSHSQSYSQNTLVVVLEDDAQDGPDHMDAHRSTAYVVGPYVRHNAVVSTRYSTVNMVRTIEDVLGLPHLNLNTAYQRPMTDVFDVTQGPAWTYSAVVSTALRSSTLNFAALFPDDGVRFAEGPDVRPVRTAAYWQSQTKGFDFSGEDRVPADLYNQVLWDGMTGGKPYPGERSGAVLRHGAEKASYTKRD